MVTQFGKYIVRFFGQLYNKNMNKERLMRLIEIMRQESDMDHKLTIAGICAKLEEKGIPGANRKTLYDDFKALEALGYDVEYDNGYYLSEAPFSVSEIKIIIDSLNSLKNLDDRFLKSLKEKLYSFISIYEAKDLMKLEYRNRHKDLHFINRLEDALQAIRHEKILEIRRTGKTQSEEIVPLFLHRNNDYYYLYYHYPGKEKIYHLRFDHILSMKITDRSDDVNIPLSNVISNIEESSSSYHGSDSRVLSFEICEDSDTLREQLQDDFSNIVFTKEGFSARVSISNAFFARLTAYGDRIKISDPEVAEQYTDYLKAIIIRNSPENRNNQ